MFSIGIDTGGTFTDGVLVNEENELWTYKTPTTPRDYAQGVAECIDGLARTQGMPAGKLLGQVQLFVHGTTIATNMMVTLQGAKVGLLVTRGHEDMLRMGAGRFGTVVGVDRETLQAPGRIDKPEPLVGLEFVHGITERVDSAGEVVIALDESQVRAAIRQLMDAGVESYAVSLLWSFRYDAHERRVAEIIQEMAPGSFMTLSSQLVPRLGEYIRASSTVINSFCGPTLSRYLTGLRDRARERGLRRPPLIMTPSGGCVPIQTAAAQPLLVLQSGPVGGVAGSAVLGDSFGERNVICTDMGGTSLDVGLVYDGSAVTATEGVASRYPYALTLVGTESIGAGGGSVASVDGQGRLHVGPASAGADPGPACYGRGGDRPTVTDADLVLGYISDTSFLGGQMSLDRHAAESAIARHIAEPLGMSVVEAAYGIYTVINAQMADFIRMKTIRAGYDPRQFSIFAYGGAGPLHAPEYAREIGARELIIPLGNTSSVFSAFGLTVTELHRVWERSHLMQEPFGWDEFSSVFAELAEEALAGFEDSGIERSSVHLEQVVTMKYAGQIHWLDVAVPAAVVEAKQLEPLREHFDATYDRVFGRGAGFREAGSEIVDFKVKATHRLPRAISGFTALSMSDVSQRDDESEVTRDVFWGGAAAPVRTRIVQVSELVHGEPVAGPLIVELPNTSVPISAADAIGLRADGSLVVQLEAG